MQNFITSYVLLFTFRNKFFFFYILILLIIFFPFLHFAYNYQGPHYSSHNIAGCYYPFVLEYIGFLSVQVIGNDKLQMLVKVDWWFAKRCCD